MKRSPLPGLLIIAGAVVVAVVTLIILNTITPPSSSANDPYWDCMETYGFYPEQSADTVDPTRLGEADRACAG